MSSLAPEYKIESADGTQIRDTCNSISDAAMPLLPDGNSSDDLNPAVSPATPRAQGEPSKSCLAWLPCRILLAAWHGLFLVLKLIFIVLSLMLYALLLMPGFLRMIWYYFFSDCVVRGILYGGKPRQRLDLYFPPHARRGVTYPVVIYVTGGAWTIGYKAWGALLARRLSEQGVLVACLDYRNFPQGDALDMLEDVNTGIAWVLSRIHRFGGDPDSVTLVGQSAGGHLAGLALIKQAEQEASGCPTLGASPVWQPTKLRAFVGVSAALDLVGLAEHRGGTFRGLLDRILSVEMPHPGSESAEAGGDVEQGGGRQRREGSRGAGLGDDRGVVRGVAARGEKRPAYRELSPLEAARRLPPGAAGLLPHTLLIHGVADKTVPAEGSERLSEALKAAGAHCRCVLVPGKTHTAFLLEDPMRGGRDLLTDNVLEAALGHEEQQQRAEEEGPAAVEPHEHKALCPGFLCSLAGHICPF